MPYLLAVLAWVNTHPYFAAAILWPVVTALVTTIFHSRTPSEYASRPPRVAALFKLLAAVGVDTPKLVDGLKLAAGGRDPAERATGLVRAFAAVTLDAPKAIEALSQLITGRVAPVAVMVLALTLSLSACVSWQQAAKNVLDVVQITCLIAHQDLPDSDAMKVCDVVGPFIGPARDVLASSRATSARLAADASARAGAARCVAKEPGQ